MKLSRPLRASAVALIACGALAGVWAKPAEEAAPAETYAMGKNAVGEDCRAESASSDNWIASGARTFNIFCGDWREPSGRVIEAPAGQMSSAINSGTWRASLELRMACGTPQATRVVRDSASAMALDCRLKTGGWPYVAFAADLGNATYLADGIPASQGVLERTIAVMAGRERAEAAATAEGERSAAIARIEATLGSRIYGANDIGAYDDLLKVGQYYNSLANFAEAELRYRQALEIRQRALPPDDPELAQPMMLLALELSNQDRFPDATALLEQAAQLAPGMTDPLGPARVQLYQAMNLANQRKCDEALGLSRKAAATFSRIYGESGVREGGLGLVFGGEEALGEYAHARFIEAHMLRCLGNLPEAADAIDAAESALERAPGIPPTWRANFLSLKAAIHDDLENFGSGESAIRTAISDRHNQFGESRPEGIARLQLGRILIDAGRTDAALEAFREAANLLRKTGSGVAYEQIAGYFRALDADVKENPEHAEANYAEMFEAGQLVRGALTAQTIAESSARLGAGTLDISKAIRDLQEARRAYFNVNVAIDRENAKPEALRNKSRLAELAAERAKLDADLGNYELAVQSASPRYNQLVGAPADFKRVSETLGENEAIFQLLVGPRDSVAMLVRRDGTRAVFYDINEKDYAWAVQRLRGALTLSMKNELRPFDVNLAYDLYVALLKPFEEQLQGVTHLITVVQGPLATIPLGVLVREQPGPIVGLDYTRVHWLVRDMAISVAPSVRSFVDLRTIAGESRAGRAFLGFGDFIPHGAKSGAFSQECSERDKEILANASRLFDSRGEIDAAARSFGGGADRILGADFNEARIRGANLSNYRVIYFATHGLLPRTLTCASEPSLMTSASAKDDGLLTTSEILDLNLDADLIVLSACNTGSASGRGEGAESLSGLARSFFYAGGRALLVSNWYVLSGGTVNLMTRMFRRLESGMKTAEALQQAELELIDTAGKGQPIYYSHPFVWAPFALVGDGERYVGRARGSASN